MIVNKVVYLQKHIAKTRYRNSCNYRALSFLLYVDGLLKESQILKLHSFQ